MSAGGPVTLPDGADPPDPLSRTGTPGGAPAWSPADSPVVAALDVGGTSIKGGLVAPDGTVLREARRPTGAGGGPTAVVSRILSFAADLLATPPAGARITAVGIGVPGIVDPDAGIARYAANLGWRDVALRDLAEQHLGLPVALGHDVRNGALAEARLGAGAGCDSVFFVAIGTGIAAGMVNRGRVDDGSSGQAGELGHLVVRPGGALCNCGGRGCLEAVASASRIARAYAAATGEEVSAREVVDRVRAGEGVATAVWREAMDALADGLAAVTVLFDPGRLVIGGGLSLAGGVLVDPIVEGLAARLTFRAPPPVAVTELGDTAGLVGAALRAFDLTELDARD